MNETDRIVSVAEAELTNTRRLFREHVPECETEGTPPGECEMCKSLAAHLSRCEEQIRLLASEDAEAEEVPLW